MRISRLIRWATVSALLAVGLAGGAIELAGAGGAPTAAFSFQPEAPTTVDAVWFIDQSEDPEGALAAWKWDFGDGYTSNERNPLHRYERGGTYEVSLTVTDAEGLTATTTQQITVAPATAELEQINVLGNVVVNGRIGVGTDNPTQSLDVAGYIKGRSGLCIGDDCRTSWPRPGGGDISGSGSTNYIAKFTGSKTIGNSAIYERNGKVGIGTTGPGAPLEIKSSQDSILRLRQSGGGWNYIEYYNDTARTLWMGMQTDNLFGINGQVYLNTSNGNVGIGTADPKGELQVGNYSDVSNVIFASKNHLRQGSTIQFRENEEWSGFQVNHNTEDNKLEISGYRSGRLVTNLLTLVRSSGNVGIGTTRPEGRLHVSGGPLRLDDNDIIFRANDTGDIVFKNSDGSQKARIWAGVGAGSNYLQFSSGDNVADIVIDPNGNVTVNGNFVVHGFKGFAMPDPDDAKKEIIYVSLEGPEAGTYIRGTARLHGGEAVIELPEHFAKVTAEEGLTVQLTPIGEWLQLYIVEKSPRQIVVREANGKDGQFDYLVQGVRKGYEDFQPVQAREAQP